MTAFIIATTLGIEERDRKSRFHVGRKQDISVLILRTDTGSRWPPQAKPA